MVMNKILSVFHFYNSLFPLPLQAAQRWLRELTRPEARATLAALLSEDLFAETSDLAPAAPSTVGPFSQPRYWAAFVLVGRAGD